MFYSISYEWICDFQMDGVPISVFLLNNILTMFFFFPWKKKKKIENKFHFNTEYIAVSNQ